jgi:hypothetical protein
MDMAGVHRTSSSVPSATTSLDPQSLFVETSHFDDLALISSFAESPKLVPRAPLPNRNDEGQYKVTPRTQQEPEPEASLLPILDEDAAATNSEEEVEVVLSPLRRSTRTAK